MAGTSTSDDDLSKTFYIVNHGILLRKLMIYGVWSVGWKLFHSFLSSLWQGKAKQMVGDSVDMNAQIISPTSMIQL